MNMNFCSAWLLRLLLPCVVYLAVLHNYLYKIHLRKRDDSAKTCSTPWSHTTATFYNVQFSTTSTKWLQAKPLTNVHFCSIIQFSSQGNFNLHCFYYCISDIHNPALYPCHPVPMCASSTVERYTSHHYYLLVHWDKTTGRPLYSQHFYVLSIARDPRRAIFRCLFRPRWLTWRYNLKLIL